jgi:hypothetical protein
VTAVSPAVDRQPAPGGPAGSVPWRRLIWVAWRQHRTALIVFAAVIGLVAIGMAATGLALHPAGHGVFSANPNSPWHLFDATDTLLGIVLPLVPLLAGVFLGAPLVAREIETGTTRFTWAQGASRTRWLIASVVPAAALLAAIAVALGLEFHWWANPLLPPVWAWRPDLFGLNALPYTGWVVFGFSLSVLLGAAIRRTVPAMAATLACYVPLVYAVARSRFFIYLPPLHRAAQTTFSARGGYGYSVSWGTHSGPGPDILNTALGWPDGLLLTGSELNHSAAWFRLHHIQVWLTYQPGSRLALFEWIEFGWLITLSAILIGLTVVFVRRRAA